MNGNGKAPHQLINQTSLAVEYYTPQWLADPVRDVLGGRIELDPASCLEANQTIQAQRIFTKEDDGLKQVWRAKTLFMNHPFGDPENPCVANCKKKRCPERGFHIDEYRPGNKDWIAYLVYSYMKGYFQAGISLTFAATSEEWAQPLFNFPVCFLRGRTNYNLPGGRQTKGVPKGSMVTYLGPDIKRFHFIFSSYGHVMIPGDRLAQPVWDYNLFCRGG